MNTCLSFGASDRDPFGSRQTGPLFFAAVEQNQKKNNCPQAEGQLAGAFARFSKILAQLQFISDGQPVKLDHKVMLEQDAPIHPNINPVQASLLFQSSGNPVPIFL